MRSFLIAWLVAFALVAVGASTVSWYVSQAAPEPRTVVAALRRPTIDLEAVSPSPPPFTEREAVSVVALRLPTSAGGRSLRAEFDANATVSYHSPEHWRVCLDGACWVAHGLGRYAEPENDLAIQRERPGTVVP